MTPPRVAITIFSAFAAFAILEIIVRITQILPPYGYPRGLFQKDPVLDYTMTPNFTGEIVFAEFRTTFSTNSLGIRDKEFGEKKENEYRILALGDSLTWGAYGVPLEQTFVKVLGKKLGSDVINAGVVGYSTDQEFAFLKILADTYQPDMVIVNFSAGTDFEGNNQTGEMTVKNGFLVGNTFQSQTPEEVRTYLLDHLRLYPLIERGVTTLFGVHKQLLSRLQEEDRQSYLYLVPPSRDYESQIEKTKKILSEMKVYLLSKGITLVVTIIPTRYQLDPQNFVSNYFARGEYDMELPQKIIREWGRQENVVVIDPLPEMQKQQSADLYWKFNPHLTEAGHEVIGSFIFDQLEAL